MNDNSLDIKITEGESKLSEITRYDGRILDFHVDKVKLPNGKESVREVVDHKDGAAILALDKGEFIFVQQYRYASRKVVTEIPAGLIEDGESPKETAIRELQEEVNLKPLNIKQILKILPSPGFTDEETNIFFASEFEQHSLKADDDEFIHILRLPVKEVEQLYKDGKFEDAKTVSALGYYFSEINK